MKEAIIKYKDSRVLELLKKMAVYLDFSISEKPEGAATKPANDSRATLKSNILHFKASAPSPFGDAAKWERQQREDRKLPFS